MWFFFFFNDAATTEIYTLSLHDALPIYEPVRRCVAGVCRRAVGGAVAGGGARGDHAFEGGAEAREGGLQGDRKSTRLNSSHVEISYAVFCLKKKKNRNKTEVSTYRPSLD